MITKKKKPYQSIFLSIFLLFLAMGVIGFLVNTNWKISQKRAELQQRIEALKKEIQILEEKTAALKNGISQTESEDYQVKRLYEQGYVEKGASQVVVLPPEEKEKEKTSEGKNIWQKFLEKLEF